MIKSKIYGFLFLSLFLIGGVYVLSESAYGGRGANLGCCINVMGTDTCQGCSGDPPCQRDEAQCNGQVEFEEDEFCSTVDGLPAVCITEAPVGCCQLSLGDDDDDCEIVTESVCNETEDSVDWTFGTECNDDTGSCGADPTGCCVVESNEGEADDDDEMLECLSDLTQERCEGEELEGEWTIGGTCDVTLTCLGEEPVFPSSIPTMSQWGLIATAGIMALFSLFYMIRRHRYNVG